MAGGIFLVVALALGALSMGGLRADSPHFAQTNLVSNISGLATITDPELVNSWGVSHSPTSPFWVSNQGTNTATLYAVTDQTNVSKVNINAPAGFVLIPTTSKGPQGPTGQVNNTNASSFPVKNGGDGGSAHFISADLNGLFRPGTRARRPSSRSRPRGLSILGWRLTAHKRAFMLLMREAAASTCSTVRLPR